MFTKRHAQKKEAMPHDIAFQEDKLDFTSFYWFSSLLSHK